MLELFNKISDCKRSVLPRFQFTLLSINAGMSSAKQLRAVDAVLLFRRVVPTFSRLTVSSF